LKKYLIAYLSGVTYVLSVFGAISIIELAFCDKNPASILFLFYAILLGTARPIGMFLESK